MANNPQITVEITPSLATTTDGTSTVTVLSHAMHDSTGGEMVTFDVLGYDFSNNDVASAKIAVKITNVSGTVTIVGSPVHLVPIQVGSSAGLQTATITVVASGSNINLNVIGVTGRTIKWVAYRSPSIEVLDSWTAVPTPADGNINVWSASNSRWEPTTPDLIDFGTLLTTQTFTSGSTYTTREINVQAGNAGGTNFTQLEVVGQDRSAYSFTGAVGGYVTLRGGIGGNAGTGGTVFLEGGVSSLHGGQVAITGGLGAAGTSGNGGTIEITGGNCFGAGDGGNVNITGGTNSEASGGYGGNITITGGSSVSGAPFGGIITLKTVYGASIIMEWVANPGKLELTNITSTTSASAGANGDVPGQVVGYITVKINGTDRKIPYYAT